jgi:hypothetical protein
LDLYMFLEKKIEECKYRVSSKGWILGIF